MRSLDWWRAKVSCYTGFHLVSARAVRRLLCPHLGQKPENLLTRQVVLPSRPYVVLDRDGTLIVERHYLSNPDQVELLPGVSAGLRALLHAGFGLVIMTNQSGIGRGYFTEATLEQVHERMCQLLAMEGIGLKEIYFCPHIPEDRCRCRKPETGMVERAQQELGLDPVVSFVVGDNRPDIELGRRVGATTLLVQTGYGAQVVADPMVKPDFIVDDLIEAASVIQTIMVERKKGVVGETVG